MKTQKTIGELIEYEVRKQQMSIIEFAEKICCKRNNVYDIFKRNTIDILQLVKISQVLNHNFFDDIAKDYSLVEMATVESEQEEYNMKAVNQFLTVVPNILNKLGKESIISLGGTEDIDIPMPDFSLPQYGIFFTIGSTWVEKSNSLTDPTFDIQLFSDGGKNSFYSIINKPFGSQTIDIKLDYKSEKEWTEMLDYVFKTFPNLNFLKSCNRFYYPIMN